MSDGSPTPEAAGGRIGAGIAWGAGAQVSTQIVRLAVLFVLARELTPRDFGLVASCMVVSETASRIAGFGLLPAITARKQITEGELSTLFWTSAAVGLTLLLGVHLCAGGFAAFVDEPEVGQVLRWLTLVFVPAGVSAVPLAILTRRLDFRSLAIAGTGSSLLGGLIGIAMALSGAGVSALVAYTIAPIVLRLFSILMLARWLPSLHFRFRELRGFAEFGLASLGSELTGVIATRLDLLLIARAIGAVSAGYYSFAIRFIESPRLRVVGVFSRALFAVASREQDKPEAFHRTARSVLKQQSLVLWPALLGLAAVSKDAILTTVGEAWLPSIDPLRVICLTAMLRSMSSFCSACHTASGHPKRPLAAGIFGVVGLPPVVLLAAPHGIVAVAWGIAGLSLLTLVMLISWLPRKYLRPRDLVSPLIAPGLASLGMLAAVVVVQGLPGVLTWVPLLRLILAIAVGGAVYISIAGWLDRKALKAAMKLIRS